GSIAAALAAAFIIPLGGWRSLFIIGILPVFLAYYVRRNLDETDDWKEANRQAMVNDKEKNTLSLLFTSPKTTYITIALTIMSSVQVAGYFGLMNWRSEERRVGKESGTRWWTSSYTEKKHGNIIV